MPVPRQTLRSKRNRNRSERQQRERQDLAAERREFTELPDQAPRRFPVAKSRPRPSRRHVPDPDTPIEPVPLIMTHALRRFAERFPGECFLTQLDNGIQYGGQRGPADQFLLSPCEAVFVVRQLRDGRLCVRTVLTKAQAINNMQLYGGMRSHSGDVSKQPAHEPKTPTAEKRIEKIDRTWDGLHKAVSEPKPTALTLSPERLAELWELARECAELDALRQHVIPRRPHRKHRQTLEAAGFVVEGPEGMEFRTEYCKDRAKLADAKRLANLEVDPLEALVDNLISTVTDVPADSVGSVPNL